MRLWSLFLLVFLLGCNPSNTAEAADIFAANQALGSGVNFGNALEAPNEGEWGLTLEGSYFDAVKAAGFKHIRLPVSWTNHASKSAPYTVDAGWLARVDWAVNQATQRGLKIVLNVHHYDELNTNPTAEETRYLAIWKQIAERYKNQPSSVYFEILNEPHDTFNTDPEIWNKLLAKAITVIRQSNPTRPLIVGPMGWNALWNLPKLKLPADSKLIVTVHFYDPMSFTHQGADWVSPPPPTGVVWDGTTPDFAPGWQNWSWDSGLKFVESALEVTYNKGYAGFYLHNDNPSSDYTQLAFRTNAPVNLLVMCKKDGTGKAVNTVAGQTTTVNLSECGNPTGLTDFFLQNNTPDPKGAFRMDLLELRGPTKTLSLISTAQSAIAEAFGFAQAWGKQNNRPIYLGEFGAFEKADMDSRVRWTAAVRSEAEKHGFSWAYWEFGAGFGIYDRTAKQWRTPLLKALVP